MSMLTIDLQEGFNGEKVVVELDGSKIFSDDNLRTRTQIGLAIQVHQDVSLGDHIIGVKVDNSGGTGEFRIDAHKTPFLGISVKNNEVVFTPKAQAFGYV